MIYAANLKCNHTRGGFLEYAKELDSKVSGENVIVFPPSSAFLEAKFKFVQGAQNFYPCDSGSFTGEIGTAMLDEFNIATVLIGHSERRALGEDEPFLKAKFDFAKQKGWDVIYCIGEDDITHMNGSTKEFLTEQLENIDLEYENLVIAYEPIWAIGTGKSANSVVITDILDFISTKTTAPLLYGGSVNEKNICDIKAIKNCNGVLVGTASWDVKNFINLIKA
ncbi:triose-phosphate isomerase [Campylobacter fetus]|uniref:triose-phosphate isomerase n=1 Tax=Campylobacter fetus TaxID=196 RepID=UPI000FCC3220|nr:triose-phosphate isomerase [Campylobacter fetus]RUT50513.1 triose-phosphate isomerase [Campylobacter fetus]RUT50830.1 triose-phosphate isomerase [Campylobacter fetus]